MNTKQISLILIAIGILIFVLGFLGEILKFIFQSNFLILAFFTVIVGVALFGYSIYKESRQSDS